MEELVRYIAQALVTAPDQVEVKRVETDQAITIGHNLKAVMADLEKRTADLADRVDIGTLALGCALWYLDLRFSDLGWRASHPRLAEWQAGFARRESMKRDWSA